MLISFNSRARVGATYPHDFGIYARDPFQFTRPGGRDQSRAEPLNSLRYVSIHAPGWARPPVSTAPLAPTDGFNSRARVGATPTGIYFAPARGRFNSRARVGATARAQAQSLQIYWFQFTRPGGRDREGRGELRAVSGVSIHAPGWARPRVEAVVMDLFLVSIHAPGWARPLRPQRPRLALHVSIHAPGWARPGAARGLRVWPRCFNSRARVGATLM